MAVLSVDIQANIEKLVALRDEVSRLENELKKVGKNTPKSEIKDLESKRAELDKDIEVYLRELGLVE